jgi:hypothetical protein
MVLNLSVAIAHRQRCGGNKGLHHAGFFGDRNVRRARNSAFADPAILTLA